MEAEARRDLVPRGVRGDGRAFHGRRHDEDHALARGEDAATPRMRLGPEELAGIREHDARRLEGGALGAMPRRERRTALGAAHEAPEHHGIGRREER